MQLQIDNMTCGGCVRGVTRAIEAVDAQAKLTADLQAKQVQVDTVAALDVVLSALQAAGYEAKAI